MSLAFSGSWNPEITGICPAPDKISTTVRKLLEDFNDRSSPTHRDLLPGSGAVVCSHRSAGTLESRPSIRVARPTSDNERAILRASGGHRHGMVGSQVR